MALPKLQHPTFEVKIPSTNKSAIFRPYTVKEQKILLMLQESKEADELSRCVKDLIESCCTSEIKADKLTYFDLEYILLRLRSKSVGEISKLSFRCNNEVEEKVCGTTNEIEVNLEDIGVDFSGAKKQEIQIQSGIVMKINYPCIASAKLLEEYNSSRDPKVLVDAISNDVVSILDAEKIYDDFTKEELKEFLQELDLTSFQNIIDFYANAPKLRKKIDFTCKKCGFKDVITLEGITDFFA